MKTAYYNLADRGSTWGAFFSFAVMAKLDGCTDIEIIAGHRGELQRYPVEVCERRARTMMIPLAKLLGLDARFDPKPSAKTSNYRNTGKMLKSRMPLPFEYVIDDEARAKAEKVAKNFGESEGYITVTLRRQQFESKRNSNLEEWMKAIVALEREGFHVYHVMDYEDTPVTPGELLAIYQRSIVNFFIPNGPSILCQYMPIPMIMLKPLIEEGAQLTPRFWKKEFGIKPGEQPAWWGPERLLWWADDTCDEILKAFNVWRENNRERVMPRECRMMERRWAKVMA